MLGCFLVVVCFGFFFFKGDQHELYSYSLFLFPGFPVQLSRRLSEGPHLQGTIMKYSNWMWHYNSVSLSQLVSAGYCFPSLIPSHWLVATDLTCPVWAEITILHLVASPSFLTQLGSSAAISRISHMHWSWKDPPEDPLVSHHEERQCVVTELMSLVCINQLCTG